LILVDLRRIEKVTCVVGKNRGPLNICDIMT
jgi:hypothetical protein